MTGPELTDRIIAQGKALVRAIEALGTVEPSGPLERALVAHRKNIVEECQVMDSSRLYREGLLGHGTQLDRVPFIAAAYLYRRYGFLSAVAMRLADYLVWHIIWGLLIQG